MKIVLSGKFCCEEASWLCWGDILYGLEHGYLNSKGVVEYAVDKLSINSPPECYELASGAEINHHEIQKCVVQLAKEECHESHFAVDSFIFLEFLWVFKNRDLYPDPLGIVEELYAEFDYPESVAPFVRYMPPEDGVGGGNERLYENWKKMLDCYREKLKRLH